MSEPQHDSRGDSIASGSRLTERLAERASGKIGVVDTDHPREMYLRTAGWIADRFPLLAHLNKRYATGDEAHEQVQPLVMGRGLNTTGEAAREVAQTVSSSAQVSRRGEDSGVQSKSSGSSPTTPVTYRVSRQPSHQALTINRATRGSDSLASRPQREPHDSIKDSGPQAGLAPDADMAAITTALPIAAGDSESEKPIGRPETGSVKVGPTNRFGDDDSGVSSGSPPDASLRNASEPPSRAHASEPVSFLQQGEVRQVSRTSAIGQKPDELIFLKRDNALPAQLANREALPASVTEMSSTPAVDGASEAREPSPNREPPTGVAPISLEMRESVPTPTLGRQSASGNLVAPILSRRETAPESPLILRQPAAAKSEVTNAALSGGGGKRDFAATGEASGSSSALNPGDGTGVIRSGAGAGQPASVHSRAADPVADMIARGQVSPSVEPLALRKARTKAGEVANSEQAAQSKNVTVHEQRHVNPAALELREGLTTPRLAGETTSRQTAPSASSPPATRAAFSSASLPLVKPQTSPRVQRKPRESNRAAVPGFETDSGSRVAREIRTASHQTETPNIVWRQSAGPVLGSQAPDPTVMLKAGGSTLARSPESSSSGGSMLNGQSGTPQPPEMNQSPGVDVGRLTEQIVRAIQRRLELERERRGMGR